MRFGIFLVMNFQLLRDHIYMKIFYEHCYQPWFEAGVYKIFTGSILISFPTVIFLKKNVWSLWWNDLPKLSNVCPWWDWILKESINTLKQEYKVSYVKQNSNSNQYFRNRISQGMYRNSNHFLLSSIFYRYNLRLLTFYKIELFLAFWWNVFQALGI